MAIDTNPNDKTPDGEQSASEPYEDADLKRRLDAYKAANPKKVSYLTWMVTKNPQKAVNELLKPELEKHEFLHKEAEKVMPAAKKFYQEQTPEARARIDAALKDVSPYHHTRSFVRAFKDELQRQEVAKKVTEATEPAAKVEMGQDGKIAPTPKAGKKLAA